jgi:hypothetical protein
VSAHRWVDAANISGSTSQNTLIAEIGAPAAKSAAGSLHFVGGGKRLIPSYECLEIGDIILSGHPKKKNGKDKWHPVRTSQLKQKCDPANCRWTHAMLYVGGLHVVESNKPTKLQTGVTLAPLTRDAHKSEFLILRYKAADFLWRREDIVRYALMSPFLTPRQYDVPGAIASHYRWRPKGADHSKRIFCSEFILECFSVQGPYLVDEFIAVTEGENKFFLPAHLAVDDRFERHPMKYFELE